MKKVSRDILKSYALYSMPPIRTAGSRATDEEIGWKGAYTFDTKKLTYIPVLVKLLIPADSLRTKYYSDNAEQYSKHRCSVAIVLGFYSYYTGRELKKVVNATSFFTDETLYFKGAPVSPNHYSCAKVVCGQGIHYFYNKECALLYLDKKCNGYGWKLRKNNMLGR